MQYGDIGVHDFYLGLSSTDEVDEVNEDEEFQTSFIKNPDLIAGRPLQTSHNIHFPWTAKAGEDLEHFPAEDLELCSAF